jgi:ATP-binding cassette subfamily B protein RaxB
MKINMILQSEGQECGLACLSMVSHALGQPIDLSSLRQRFPNSLRGVSAQTLIEDAAQIGLLGRPLRLDMSELKDLRFPSILHWDMTHFVVLEAVKGDSVDILDPAVGRRRLNRDEVNRSFTGVALEFERAADFSPVAPVRNISIARLASQIRGLKKTIAGLIAVSASLEVFSIVAPLLNQIVIDEVVGGGDLDLLSIVMIGFGLLLMTQTLISAARSWMLASLGQDVSLQWRSNVFSHLLSLSPFFFERRHIGDVSSRFSSVAGMQQILTNGVMEAVVDGCMALATLGMMLLYAPKLAIVTISAALIYSAIKWFSSYAYRRVSTERLLASAKENTLFLESIRAITPIKLANKEQLRRSIWTAIVTDIKDKDLSLAQMGVGVVAAQMLIFGVENILVLGLGAHAVIVPQAEGAVFTVGMLLAFVAYKSQFLSRVAKLVEHLTNFRMMAVHGARLADLVLEPKEKQGDDGVDPEGLPPTLEFRNVSFRYGRLEPWLLRNVSFRLEAGDSAALVGPSGSGKSTFLKLALGLLEPSSGEVLCGGLPLSKLGVRNWRNLVSCVLQEDYLLTGTIKENISFFDAELDMGRVRECARKAGIDAQIDSMPMGYNTLVGDLGSGLSGGQRQRILLARALYRRPKILLLDEATSHLDIALERSIGQELAALSITRLSIAHRPETVAMAATVLLLRGGELRLLKRPGPVLETPAEELAVTSGAISAV